jgi:hypothetical protein
MSLILEKDIEKYLIKRMKQLSAHCYKWQSSVTGVPDRIVFLNGKIHLVELKTKTGKLSERQKVMFRDLQRHGFPVAVLHGADEVDAFLSALQEDQARAPEQVLGEPED